MCHRRESPFCSLQNGSASEYNGYNWDLLQQRALQRLDLLSDLLRSYIRSETALVMFIQSASTWKRRHQIAQQQQLTPWQDSIVHVVVRLLQHALKKPTVSPFRAAYWVFPLDFRPICAPQQRRGYIFKVLTLPSWPLQAHPPLGALKIWLRADELGCAQIRWALRDNSFWVN